MTSPEVAVSAKIRDRRLDIRTVPEIALILVRQQEDSDEQLQYVTASTPSMFWMDQNLDGTKEVEHQLRIVRKECDIFGEYLIDGELIGRTLLHGDEFRPVVEVLRERLTSAGLIQLLYDHRTRLHVARLIDRKHNEIVRKEGLEQGVFGDATRTVTIYPTKRGLTATFHIESENFVIGVEWWAVPVDAKPHGSTELPEDPLHDERILEKMHQVE